MSEMMDRLLTLDLPQPETRRKRVKRLGLTLTLKELSYNRITALAKGEEADVQMLLEGVCDPDFKADAWWRDHMGCATPAEAVKKLFRPGEIRAVVRELDELAGYGQLVLEDVTKN